uniref:Uncharacterized protein n=1 Tax=Brassica oleracea var. oleracea TaxID=109376 RepID=A0A0D3ANF9_BRAOL
MSPITWSTSLKSSKRSLRRTRTLCRQIAREATTKEDGGPPDRVGARSQTTIYGAL